MVCLVLDLPTGAEQLALTKSSTREEARCPYCVVDDKFHPKFHPLSVLRNGRLICEKCAHIVFPDDTSFKCPCPKCVEIDFSPRIRRLQQRESRSHTNAKTSRREFRQSLVLYLQGMLSALESVVRSIRTR